MEQRVWSSCHKQDCQVCTWLAIKRFTSEWVMGQVVDERLAGLSVEYLGFNKNLYQTLKALSQHRMVRPGRQRMWWMSVWRGRR